MKVREFIKNHYVIFVPIILIIVFILTYAVYNIQKIYNSYSQVEEEKLYTFFAGTKVYDKFSIKRNRKGEIIDIRTEKDINLNTVIYNDKKNKVIFPHDMTIIFISDGYKQFKVNKYASLTYDSSNTTNRLHTTDYNKEVNNFILYDGNDLYFFAESSILKIGKNTINLSPMSYVIVNTNNSLEYYDSELDKNVVMDIKNENVSVTSNSYNVDLSADKVKKFNDYLLLINPKYLTNIK